MDSCHYVNYKVNLFGFCSLQQILYTSFNINRIFICYTPIVTPHSRGLSGLLNLVSHILIAIRVYQITRFQTRSLLKVYLFHQFFLFSLGSVLLYRLSTTTFVANTFSISCICRSIDDLGTFMCLLWHRDPTDSTLGPSIASRDFWWHPGAFNDTQELSMIPRSFKNT